MIQNEPHPQILILYTFSFFRFVVFLTIGAQLLNERETSV